METVTNLFQEYSFESIFIFIILLVVAFKFISEAFDWLWKRIRSVADKQTKQEHSEEELHQFIGNWEDRTSRIESTIENTNKRLSKIEERQQEATRTYIIEAYHKYCYELKTIDELSMQSIERRYLYYKMAGGDSFIDNLVKEIRELPRTTVYNDAEKEDKEYGRIED